MSGTKSFTMIPETVDPMYENQTKIIRKRKKNKEKSANKLELLRSLLISFRVRYSYLELIWNIPEWSVLAYNEMARWVATFNKYSFLPN